MVVSYGETSGFEAVGKEELVLVNGGKGGSGGGGSSGGSSGCKTNVTVGPFVSSSGTPAIGVKVSF